MCAKWDPGMLISQTHLVTIQSTAVAQPGRKDSGADKGPRLSDRGGARGGSLLCGPAWMLAPQPGVCGPREGAGGMVGGPCVLGTFSPCCCAQGAEVTEIKPSAAAEPPSAGGVWPSSVMGGWMGLSLLGATSGTGGWVGRQKAGAASSGHPSVCGFRPCCQCDPTAPGPTGAIGLWGLLVGWTVAHEAHESPRQGQETHRGHQRPKLPCTIILPCPDPCRRGN